MWHAWETEEVCTKIGWEIWRKKYNLGDLGVVGWIIFKLFPNKWDESSWIGLVLLRIGRGVLEWGRELWGTIKCGDFLNRSQVGLCHMELIIGGSNICDLGVNNTSCWPVSGSMWEKIQHSTYCTIFIDKFHQFNMWMLVRMYFQVCCITYKHSCPVRVSLYPYRHLWPVCRCLSSLPALLTSMWICLSVRSRCCAHCRTEASDAKSSFNTINWPAPSVSFVSRRMSAAASSVFFRSLHAMITRAPVVQKYHVGYLHQAICRHTRTCAVFGYLEVRLRWNPEEVRTEFVNYITHLHSGGGIAQSV